MLALMKICHTGQGMLTILDAKENIPEVCPRLVLTQGHVCRDLHHLAFLQKLKYWKIFCIKYMIKICLVFSEILREFTDTYTFSTD